MNSLKPFCKVFAFTLVFFNTSCSLFQRSPQAENTEPTVSTHGHNPHETQSMSQQNPDLSLSQHAFETAKQAYENSQYSEAKERLEGYRKDYPGYPYYDQASYLLAVTCFQLNQYEQSLSIFEQILPHLNVAAQRAEALLLMGQSYLFLKKYQEALLTTFDLMPDQELEKRLGLNSNSNSQRRRKITIPLADRVRGHLLRAQIFARMDQQDSAKDSLKKGKRLLEDATGYGIPKENAKKLKGEFAWREIEVLASQCQASPPPAKMSEDEFLDYSKTYYQCIAPGQSLMCEVGASGNTAALSAAKTSYTQMIRYPLFLKEKLPPPARTLKNKEALPYYEAEMKDLIERTVSSKSKDFQSLEDCGLSI